MLRSGKSNRAATAAGCLCRGAMEVSTRRRRRFPKDGESGELSGRFEQGGVGEERGLLGRHFRHQPLALLAAGWARWGRSIGIWLVAIITFIVILIVVTILVAILIAIFILFAAILI